MNPARHQQRGFTLVEMLLAIGLLVMLVGLAYGTLRIGVRGWEAADAHAERDDALRVAWPFLHQALENARPLPGTQAGTLRFDGDRANLAWVSELPAHFAAAGPRLLVLSVEADPDHDRRQLVLRSVGLDDASAGGAVPDTADTQRAVLVDDLDTLDIAYYGESQGNAPPAWQDNWQHRNALPQLVRLDIVPNDAGPWPSLYARPYLAGELPDAEQIPDEERED